MAKAKPLFVDFTGVESSNRIRIPEDDYRFKIIGAKQDESKEGNPLIMWEFEITEGKHKGKRLNVRTMLTKKSLWFLKNLLEALGVSVPSKRVALRLDKYIGMEVGGTVTDNEYNGRISSQVSDFIPIDVLDDIEEEDEEDEDEDEDEEEDEDEDDEEEEEEEEPKPKKKAKKGKKAKADEDEELEELDLDEL